MNVFIFPQQTYTYEILYSFSEIEFPGVSQYLMDEIKNELKKYDINPTRNTHVTLKIVFQYADDTQVVVKHNTIQHKQNYFRV